MYINFHLAMGHTFSMVCDALFDDSGCIINQLLYPRLDNDVVRVRRVTKFDEVRMIRVYRQLIMWFFVFSDVGSGSSRHHHDCPSSPFPSAGFRRPLQMGFRACFHFKQSTSQEQGLTSTVAVSLVSKMQIICESSKVNLS
jgi:hypothetical protein